MKPNGVFVIVELSITNRTNRPLDWASGLDGRAELTDGENSYAHNGGEAAFAHRSDEQGLLDAADALDPIQPGETRAASLGFDVPKQVPDLLDRPGAGLVLVESENIGLLGYEPVDYGNIRFWK